MKWKLPILGRLGVLILIPVLAGGGVLLAARFHDGPFAGPLAIVAAGPFKTGELHGLWRRVTYE